MTPEEIYSYDSFLRKSLTFKNGRFSEETPRSNYILSSILDYKIDGRIRHHEK